MDPADILVKMEEIGPPERLPTWTELDLADFAIEGTAASGGGQAEDAENLPPSGLSSTSGGKRDRPRRSVLELYEEAQSIVRNASVIKSPNKENDVHVIASPKEGDKSQAFKEQKGTGRMSTSDSDEEYASADETLDELDVKTAVGGRASAGSTATIETEYQDCSSHFGGSPDLSFKEEDFDLGLSPADDAILRSIIQRRSLPTPDRRDDLDLEDVPTVDLNDSLDALAGAFGVMSLDASKNTEDNLHPCDATLNNEEVDLKSEVDHDQTIFCNVSSAFEDINVGQNGSVSLLSDPDLHPFVPSSDIESATASQVTSGIEPYEKNEDISVLQHENYFDADLDKEKIGDSVQDELQNKSCEPVASEPEDENQNDIRIETAKVEVLEVFDSDAPEPKEGRLPSLLDVPTSEPFAGPLQADFVPQEIQPITPSVAEDQVEPFLHEDRDIATLTHDDEVVTESTEETGPTILVEVLPTPKHDVHNFPCLGDPEDNLVDAPPLEAAEISVEKMQLSSPAKFVEPNDKPDLPVPCDEAIISTDTDSEGTVLLTDDQKDLKPSKEKEPFEMDTEAFEAVVSGTGDGDIVSPEEDRNVNMLDERRITPSVPEADSAVTEVKEVMASPPFDESVLESKGEEQSQVSQHETEPIVQVKDVDALPIRECAGYDLSCLGEADNLVDAAPPMGVGKIPCTPPTFAQLRDTTPVSSAEVCRGNRASKDFTTAGPVLMEEALKPMQEAVSGSKEEGVPQVSQLKETDPMVQVKDVDAIPIRERAGYDLSCLDEAGYNPMDAAPPMATVKIPWSPPTMLAQLPDEAPVSSVECNANHGANDFSTVGPALVEETLKPAEVPDNKIETEVVEQVISQADPDEIPLPKVGYDLTLLDDPNYNPFVCPAQVTPIPFDELPITHAIPMEPEASNLNTKGIAAPPSDESREIDTTLEIPDGLPTADQKPLDERAISEPEPSYHEAKEIAALAPLDETNHVVGIEPETLEVEAPQLNVDDIPLPSKGYNLSLLDDPNYNPFGSSAKADPLPADAIAADIPEKVVEPEPSLLEAKVVADPVVPTVDVIPESRKDEVPQIMKNEEAELIVPAEVPEAFDDIPLPKKGYNLSLLDDPNYNPFVSAPNAVPIPFDITPNEQEKPQPLPPKVAILPPVDEAILEMKVKEVEQILPANETDLKIPDGVSPPVPEHAGHDSILNVPERDHVSTVVIANEEKAAEPEDKKGSGSEPGIPNGVVDDVDDIPLPKKGYNLDLLDDPNYNPFGCPPKADPIPADAIIVSIPEKIVKPEPSLPKADEVVAVASTPVVDIVPESKMEEVPQIMKPEETEPPVPAGVPEDFDDMPLPTKSYNLDLLDDPNYNPFGCPPKADPIPLDDRSITPSEQTKPLKAQLRTPNVKEAVTLSPVHEVVVESKEIKKPLKEVGQAPRVQDVDDMPISTTRVQDVDDMPIPTARVQDADDLPIPKRGGYDLTCLDDPEYNPFAGPPPPTTAEKNVRRKTGAAKKSVKPISKPRAPSACDGAVGGGVTDGFDAVRPTDKEEDVKPAVEPKKVDETLEAKAGLGAVPKVLKKPKGPPSRLLKRFGIKPEIKSTEPVIGGEVLPEAPSEAQENLGGRPSSDNIGSVPLSSTPAASKPAESNRCNSTSDLADVSPVVLDDPNLGKWENASNVFNENPDFLAVFETLSVENKDKVLSRMSLFRDFDPLVSSGVAGPSHGRPSLENFRAFVRASLSGPDSRDLMAWDSASENQTLTEEMDDITVTAPKAPGLNDTFEIPNPRKSLDLVRPDSAAGINETFHIPNPRKSLDLVRPDSAAGLTETFHSPTPKKPLGFDQLDVTGSSVSQPYFTLSSVQPDSTSAEREWELLAELDRIRKERDDYKEELDAIKAQTEKGNTVLREADVQDGLKANHDNLKMEVEKLRQENASYKRVMREYDLTISQLMNEKVDAGPNAEKIKHLSAERDAAVKELESKKADLECTEKAFNGIMEKYERLRKTVKIYEENQKKLKNALEQARKGYEESEKIAAAVTEAAQKKLEEAKNTFRAMVESKDMEINALKCQMRKLEVDVESLQAQVTQKQKEVLALNNIIEEMMASMGVKEKTG